MFDDKRKPKRELKDMLFHKISLGDIFNILGGEGEVSPEAFRKLHGVLFKSDGRKTDELSHIIDSGIDFASVSSILSGSGAKAAEAFKDFYDALFDKEGGKKPNLERILNEKISFVEISRVLYGTGAKAKERFNQLCGFWFDFEGEEVSDVYIASIFNLKVLKNNSVFGLPENIAQICVCLSTWSSEMLMGKNVQSLSDKLIKNVKKISAQFKFQDIAPIYNAITKLYESKQRSASFSHANFDNSIYNDCVSDLAARAIAIAPVKHNIRYIMNTVFSLSRLTHAGLVIDEDLLCELIRSLTKGLGDCRLDSSYSDENYLCIRVLVNSLCTLVYLIYQNGERDAIINKELAQGMLRMVSNLNSLQKDVKSSTEILSILGRVSKLTKDKVEIKFFQRTIGRVLYRLHFIGEHRNDDLEKKALSVVHELSDELKNLLHSDWYLDYLLGKTRVEGHLKRTKGESPITSDNILIDEDQPEKYTLKQIKEQGKIKYKAGIEDQIKYNYRALGLNSDFNVEKNDSSIILAKIACLEEETVYGLFLNTQERISPKAFLGTGNREMNECTLERYSQISTNSEKERNWVSYLNHASIGTSNVVATLNRIQRHACFILSTSREILPGHQLLFNYKQDCSRKLDSTPIYLHSLIITSHLHNVIIAQKIFIMIMFSL
ncbi:SET domain-containing protein [Wolbachia endosymbiont (group B) of Camptogramma bilineatum]|uniref:SET domain-containing protein n=1 Tax=Wolbachia endosymbiont (group B) of Camptogramma bilineatum TaxID=2953991 RepID=UPI0022309F50|nr:SET domain-containing protein [Wolbachia endosymbiont (group B) of Camptogramma bilineatum]